MSRIRCCGTIPERRLYAMVRGLLGPRRKITRNLNTLPGRPDILVPSLKLIILADGCFYHCCPKHGHSPKSNVHYWLPKLARNVARDMSNRRMLRRMGFSVWRFWEHDLRGKALAKTQRRLQYRLAKIFGLLCHGQLFPSTIRFMDRVRDDLFSRYFEVF